MDRVVPVTESRVRCPWSESDPLRMSYHDTEWGVPLHDDRRIFEALTLESAQAGLNWLLIFSRREAYRDAFSGFEPQAVARYGHAEVERLMYASGIIRCRPQMFVGGAVHAHVTEKSFSPPPATNSCEVGFTT